MVFLRLKNKKRRLGASLNVNFKDFCALDRYRPVKIFFNHEKDQV
jgi:hypothetical protein